jgi:ABC-type antimicrobial peptide transport system permease subunit
LFAYAPVDDFSNSLTVLQSLRQKNIENLVSYDADLAEQIFFISQLKSIVMYVMLILSIFVILAMSLSLFSVLYNYISSNSKYYAMVRAIGVKRQTIFTILFIELLLLLLVSMLFIVPISGLFLVILNYCLINIIAVGVPITLNQLLEAVFPMFLLFSIGIISISMILLRWNQRKEICIILKQ